jgi:hypothetical protein
MFLGFRGSVVRPRMMSHVGLNKTCQVMIKVLVGTYEIPKKASNPIMKVKKAIQITLKGQKMHVNCAFHFCT